MNYILYDYYAPAFRAGGPIQSLKNLVVTIQGDIAVTVVCSHKDVDGTRLDVVTNKFTHTVFGNVFYGRNFPDFFKHVKSGECFFINGLYSLHFNLLPILLLRGRKVISVRGMLTEGGLQRSKLKKKLYLTLLRTIGVHRTSEFHATNDEEATDIKRVFGSTTKIWIIPNLPKLSNYTELPEKGNGEVILATVALISGMKNHLRVLQSLKYCTGNIAYHIYGAIQEHEYWQKCQNVISTLPRNIKVCYHGEIEPVAVEAAIADAHVYIQPSISENFGHSLYEALAVGRPVITSITTPWKELKKSKAGINVQHTDEHAIAKAINFFCDMGSDEMKNWSLGARSYARNRIDVEKVKSQYVEMFRGGKG